MPIIQEAIYRINKILIKTSMTFFFPTEIEQQQKSNMEPQQSPNCQSNPEKKEQSWRYNLPRLKTILQSYSNQNRISQAKKMDTDINGKKLKVQK